MGLRRTTTSVPLQQQLHSIEPAATAAATVPPSQGRDDGHEEASATTTSASPLVSSVAAVAAACTETEPPAARSHRARASTSRIAAEKGAAVAPKRGLSARKARPAAKRGAVAAASPDSQDGMAPALTTEPTVVAPQKKDAASPQPEIFGEVDHDQSMAGNTDTGSADNNMGVGGGEQELRPQLKKAAKRGKKDDELPLKELRSTRRRSNLPPPVTPMAASPTPVTRQTNGKTNRRWTTGCGVAGNGDALVSESPRAKRGKAKVSATAPATVAPVEEPKEEKPVTASENGECVNKKTEPVKEEQPEQPEKKEATDPVEIKTEKDAQETSADAAGESSSLAEPTQAINNNNYLDKNRVPLVDSAVKEEDTELQGDKKEVQVKVEPETAADTPATTTNGPESNSESVEVPVIKSEHSDDMPVAKEEQKRGDEKEAKEESTKTDTLGDGGCVTQSDPPVPEQQPETEPSAPLPPAAPTAEQSQPVPEEPPQLHLMPPPLALPEQPPSDQSLMLPPEINTVDQPPLSAVDQFKVTVSDAAFLEELVLTTPTKKLTEQLCMVLKDQEMALEQQEQQERQEQILQQPQSNPSSQTMLKESAEMEQMLGDLAATSELDLLQVFGGGQTEDDAVGAGAHGNLLSLLGGDDDVDMIMGSAPSSTNASPEKSVHGRASLAVPVSVREEVPMDEDSPELDVEERKQMLAEMEQELSQMQRRRDFLLRRLRKQQVHHLGRQMSEEVVGLFELSTRATAAGPAKSVPGSGLNINKPKYLNKPLMRPGDVLKTALSGAAAEAAAAMDVEQLTPATVVHRIDPPSPVIAKGRSKTAVGHHPFIKPPSANSILSFVEKVVAHKNQEPGPAAIALPIKGANHKMRPALLAKSTLDDGHRLQLTNNVGLLKTELRIVEQAVDSEATASSSGGESADELINYANTVQETLAM